MAHKNIDSRRSMVGKVLEAGIKIGPGEAKCLAMVYNCSESAITADVKLLRTATVSGSVDPAKEGSPPAPARGRR